MEDGLRNRLQMALDSSDVKKAHLADIFDVSAQAVGQWFKTGRVAKGKLPELASVLNVSLDWLLTGKGTMRRLDPLEGLEAGGQGTVPVIDLSKAHGPADKWVAQAMENSTSVVSLDLTPQYGDVSEKEIFAVVVPDTSMEPAFSQGDHLIISRKRRPKPGDFVLAATSDGRHPAVIRKYRELSLDSFELVPANDDYPSLMSSTDEPTWYIAGVVTEHRRRI